MSRSKTILSTLSTCAVAFVFATGFRGGCGAHSPEQKVKHIERAAAHVTEDALDELDATDAQRAKVSAGVNALVPEATALVLSHMEVKETLKAEWKKASPDRAALHTLVDKQLSALSALLHHAVDTGVDVHQTLTEAQRLEVADHFE